MFKRLVDRFSTRHFAGDHEKSPDYLRRAPILTLILSDAAYAQQLHWGVSVPRAPRRG